MEFSVEKNVRPEEQKNSACIIAGIFESRPLPPVAERLDKISKGYISNLLQGGELKGKLGSVLLLHRFPNILTGRVLLINCGKEFELEKRQYNQLIQKSINALNNTGSEKAICFLTELYVKNSDTYWKIRRAIEIIEDNLYDFSQLKTRKNELIYSLRKIIFNLSDCCELNIGECAIRHGLAISTGIKVAKDLGNMPPNICNATYLSFQSSKIAEAYNKNVVTQIINKQKMKEIGMHAYLAVSNGSRNEPLMSIIEYKGNLSKNKRPIVLIGKGLTFDSGGISIKSAENMDEMKYDMCGAAAVYGTMKVLAELQLPVNVIGIIAGCENMPGSCAYRPGDILTTMSGQTVEVLNTDAEGRLVICDVLTYVEKFNPEIVIDIATLTGACVIALGHHITGLISNHQLLANSLISSSEQAEDLVWQLPMNDDYQEQLESNFADMTNVGGRPGSTITAGCFLSRFACKYKWAHLDIAGTAWRSGKSKGATGRPVALLSQFLLNYTGFRQ